MFRTNSTQFLIIDDSFSMKQHWSNVVEIATLLTFLPKIWQRGGVRFRFLGSGMKRFVKSRLSVQDIVSGTQQWFQTDLYNGVEELLEEHFLQFDGLCDLYPHARRDPPAWSVYILTDGTSPLSASESQEPQSNTAAVLDSICQPRKTWLLPHDQIAIQFIQFGDSSSGSARLNTLAKLDKHASWSVLS